MYEEIANDSQIELIWFNILDAICYTTWRAFLYENKKSLPQTLELESDETIDKFTEKLTKIDGYQEEWAERLKQYLMQNYPAGSEKKIQREELLKLIA